jgi:pyruvate,water dikinase
MTERTERNERHETGHHGTQRGDATSRGPYVLSLRDAAEASVERVGGKAATLARLLVAGHPVPDGFVLTAEAARAAQEEARRGGRSDPAELPADVAAALHDALADVGDAPVAVRSSGVAEDLADASYAGQYETYLDVRGADAVADAVLGCWSSARAARVRAYRGAHGDDGAETPPMAVLIQRMVPADAAGVAFTADPVSGDRETVIVHAVAGTGERLVAGEAAPEAWSVRDGVAETAEDAPSVLDEAQARHVAEAARRVEQHEGRPQDVEWALADGRLHLVQARPITRLPTPPAIDPPPGPWMKDTVHYEGPLSPLAATAYLPRLERGGSRMCEVGLPLEGVRQRTLGWEVYSQPVPVSSEERLEERAAAARAYVREDRDADAVRRWHEHERADIESRIDALRERPLRDLSDAELDDHLQDTLDLLQHGQEVHFELFVPYVRASYDLARTCEELLGWNLVSALDLVTGLSEAAAEPTYELARLARDVRARPDVAEVVSSWHAGAPVEQRRAELRDAAPDLAERLDEHIARHGCRVPAYDLGDPTYAERPEETLQLLQDLAAGIDDPFETRERLARTREEAAERARRQLAEDGASPETRRRFEAVLERARDRWGLREDNLALTDAMPNGLIRWAALEIGRRLVERRLLRHADDAVWLELDELRSALRGAQPDDDEPLLDRADRRRGEHAWIRAHPGPPMRGEAPGEPPSSDDLPPEMRYLKDAMDWIFGLEYGPAGAEGDGEALEGQAGSPGRATATARIVRDASEFHRLAPGEVLVCPMTTPAWTVLFARAAAVVTDTGSPLSHAAIVAREHGIPAVVGTKTATSELRDGERVTVDGAGGTVTPAATG